jgi:hypothetical protein
MYIMTNDVKIGIWKINKSRHVIPWCAMEKKESMIPWSEEKEGKKLKILYDDMTFYSTSY